MHSQVIPITPADLHPTTSHLGEAVLDYPALAELPADHRDQLSWPNQKYQPSMSQNYEK